MDDLSRLAVEANNVTLVAFLPAVVIQTVPDHGRDQPLSWMAVFQRIVLFLGPWWRPFASAPIADTAHSGQLSAAGGER